MLMVPLIALTEEEGTSNDTSVNFSVDLTSQETNLHLRENL